MREMWRSFSCSQMSVNWSEVAARCWGEFLANFRDNRGDGLVTVGALIGLKGTISFTLKMQHFCRSIQGSFTKINGPIAFRDLFQNIFQPKPLKTAILTVWPLLKDMLEML
jgi:hypothetical protein